jgi:hypothetical protein
MMQFSQLFIISFVHFLYNDGYYLLADATTTANTTYAAAAADTDTASDSSSISPLDN